MKRGERAPWLVRYRWSSGITGVASFITPEGRDAFVALQLSRRGPAGEVCRVSTWHRATPEEVTELP